MQAVKASGLWWHFWSSQPKLANAYIQTMFTPEQYSMSAPMYFHHKEKNSCLMNECIPHFSLLPWFPFFFFLVSTALCPLVICCFPNFQTLRVWLCSKIKSYRGNAVKMSLLGLAQSSMTGIVKKRGNLDAHPRGMAVSMPKRRASGETALLTLSFILYLQLPGLWD